MGADGLFDKFDVARTDGRSARGEKHERCDYFVLDMSHDPYAAAAVRAYANACAETHPQLAEALDDRLATNWSPKLVEIEASAGCLSR